MIIKEKVLRVEDKIERYIIDVEGEGKRHALPVGSIEQAGPSMYR
jgi:creatinine amidohydrolase/Fe(II)-dependent formamide hydrolase-like protein